MRKHKLFLLAFFLPIFGLFSCQGNNTDPYKDKIVSDDLFKCDLSKMKTNYQSGSSISNDNVVVTYNGAAVDYLGNDNLTKEKYFFTTSNVAPTNNRLKPSQSMTTNKQTFNLNVYVAYIRSDDKICISNAKAITITNSKALNPVIYYVGGAVVIVGVAAIIFFTKRYKETH